MYKIRRFSKVRNALDVLLERRMFDCTTERTKGNGWIELKDSDIFPGAKRVNSDLLRRFNMEWITEGPVRYVIERTNGFNNDLRLGSVSYIGKKGKISFYLSRDDRRKVKRYINDLLDGLVGVDNPSKDIGYADGTHTLLEFSKKGVSIAYSKSLSNDNRLTYEVYKPEVCDDGTSVVIIKLVNCIGHRFYNKPYLIYGN